jgi:transcriptional regulator with XRE-family HTH domain
MIAQMSKAPPVFRLDLDRLKKAVERSGLSLNEIEARAGLGQNYLYKVLSGKRPGVAAVSVAAVAHVLGLRLEQVVVREKGRAAAPAPAVEEA